MIFLPPPFYFGMGLCTLCLFMEVSNLKICFGWGSQAGVSEETLFGQ